MVLTEAQIAVFLAALDTVSLPEASWLALA